MLTLLTDKLTPPTALNVTVTECHWMSRRTPGHFRCKGRKQKRCSESVGVCQNNEYHRVLISHREGWIQTVSTARKTPELSLHRTKTQNIERQRSGSNVLALFLDAHKRPRVKGSPSWNVMELCIDCCDGRVRLTILSQESLRYSGLNS